MIWSLIHLADILLWLFTTGSAAYIVFFAIASIFNKKKGAIRAEHTDNPCHFLILIPAYHEDKVILNTVNACLHQDYPQERMTIVVISDHMSLATNKQLAAMPVILLQPSFEKSSKAKALQYAIKSITENEELRTERYDYLQRKKSDHSSNDKTNHTSQLSTLNSQLSTPTHVVILDADNIVEPDFLTRLNHVCQQGYQAIQCHRTAKNANNDIAVLDGISEEINNTIFRRAHNNIGLSSALIGSGMCFSYQWFSNHVDLLRSAVEDRELEALLMRENIFVKYEEDICVMDEKVSSQENFQRQRMRWITGQVQTLQLMMPYLPTAIRTLNINYIDKTIQQMLIPRSILLILLPTLSVVMTLLSPVWSIKWWTVTVCFCIALLTAIPRQLRTRTIFARLKSLPQLAWRMLANLLHIDKKNTDFIHTTHDK